MERKEGSGSSRPPQPQTRRPGSPSLLSMSVRLCDVSLFTTDSNVGPVGTSKGVS